MRSSPAHPGLRPVAHRGSFVLLISNDLVRILKHISYAEWRGPLSTWLSAHAHAHTLTHTHEYLFRAEAVSLLAAHPPDTLITFCLLKFASNGNLFASRMLTHVRRYVKIYMKGAPSPNSPDDSPWRRDAATESLIFEPGSRWLCYLGEGFIFIKFSFHSSADKTNLEKLSFIIKWRTFKI